MGRRYLAEWRYSRAVNSQLALGVWRFHAVSRWAKWQGGIPLLWIPMVITKCLVIVIGLITHKSNSPFVHRASLSTQSLSPI